MLAGTRNPDEMAFRFITVPPQSVCTNAQQFLQALSPRANSSTVKETKRAPASPRTVSADGGLTKWSIEREATTDPAPRHQRMFFLRPLSAGMDVRRDTIRAPKLLKRLT
ncbi:MAG: hypothetical protein DMG45_18295 [Acidobacteria bacterium]|nr:MAG: hypothetical protein DMG45_18295 [Acidobacteriota bacterium]